MAGRSSTYMRKQERSGWVVVATLFVSLLTVYGATIDSFGVFFMPLVKEFGWSHARVSMLPTALSASPLLALPVAGWLLDRIQARFVITAGVLLTGLALLGVTRVHSFGVLFVLFLLIGIGIAFSGFMPVSVVVAKWFNERRATATGIALSGSSVGGAIMILVANFAMSYGGWRFGYAVLALPLFVIAAPIVLLMVHERPASAAATNFAPDRHRVSMNFRTALAYPSVWFIAFAQFTSLLVSAACYLHIIPYLVSHHYSERYGAIVSSLTSVLIGGGKVIAGPITDRVGGRVSLIFIYIAEALLLATLIVAPGSKTLITIAICGIGIVTGGCLTVTPILLAANVGLKQFGSISGIVWLCGTLGMLAGPVIAGRIFDLTADYIYVWELLVPFCVLAGIGIYRCKPGTQTEPAQAAETGVFAVERVP
jgi:MFS family permease